MKGGAEFNPDAGRGELLPKYLKLCGWALALAHAKSGDAAAIAGYLGKTEAMDEALARFAFAYADQTERDFDALTSAARAKRIPVAQAAV
jgi:predicted alpha/beta hydrolase